MSPSDSKRPIKLCTVCFFFIYGHTMYSYDAAYLNMISCVGTKLPAGSYAYLVSSHVLVHERFALCSTERLSRVFFRMWMMRCFVVTDRVPRPTCNMLSVRVHRYHRCTVPRKYSSQVYSCGRPILVSPHTVA